VACVAAAGDGAGPIAHPAALPGVLAVGAIGQLGSFPPGSGIAAELSGPPTPDGLFAPRFANHGPGLDCCAPGVAIVSGLPPASYGPLGGTATAAAHVAAIAVLVLAHHPQFRPEPGRHPVARDASRADRLFQLILASCRPLPDLGPLRSGAGIPDAAVAVGVAPWGSHSRWHAAVPRWSASPGDPRGQEEPTRAALANLEAAMRSAGLISARAAPENQTAAERAGSLSRAGADAIGHAEQRFLCDARREPAVPAEDPAGVHPPGPRSTPAAGPSAPSRPAGPAGKTTRHGRCWSAPPGGICPAPGQAAEHVGDVGQGTGMERVIRQRIPARSHARDGHG